MEKNGILLNNKQRMENKMAIIKCPECGQDVSDKARICIHCGITLNEETLKKELKCTKCGEILSEQDNFCIKCGSPVMKPNQAEAGKQQTRVMNIDKSKKKKILIICIAVAMAVCIIGGVGFKLFWDYRTEQNYKNTYNNYIEDLRKVQLLMLTSGSKAETLCNLTLNVWGNTIHEKRNSKTDKYTRPKGYFVSDFNEAIVNLYSDSDTEETVTEIKNDLSSVKELIKKLQDPPAKLEKCYDTVSDLYEAYKTLTDLAVSPSGSYNSFSSQIDKTVSDFTLSYDKLDNQIPEQK